MSLRTYRSKRDFRRTPEPDGTLRVGTEARQEAPIEAGGRFVIHRHRARRLHYDLRLEIDGVLASWAVPRGPSLDPAAKRLAVQVEDHPLGYFGFEGVIPAGQYGGGDVIVWDWGRWTPEPGQPDAVAALHAGELKVRLEGESETCGAPTPVPLREAEWGEPVALSETVREAVLAPTAEGEKVTEMEQLAPVARVAPQVLV